MRNWLGYPLGRLFDCYNCFTYSKGKYFLPKFEAIFLFESRNEKCLYQKILFKIHSRLLSFSYCRLFIDKNTRKFYAEYKTHIPWIGGILFLCLNVFCLKRSSLCFGLRKHAMKWKFVLWMGHKYRYMYVKYYNKCLKNNLYFLSRIFLISKIWNKK